MHICIDVLHVLFHYTCGSNRHFSLFNPSDLQMCGGSSRFWLIFDIIWVNVFAQNVWYTGLAEDVCHIPLFSTVSKITDDRGPSLVMINCRSGIFLVFLVNIRVVGLINTVCCKENEAV